MEFNKKIFELACRDYVMDVVNESKYLRSRLNLIEHAKIYDWVKNRASYNQLASIIISEEANGEVTSKMILEFENTAKSCCENFMLNEGLEGTKYIVPDPKAGRQEEEYGKYGKGYHGMPFKGKGRAFGKFMTKERHPLRFLGKVAGVIAIILAARYLVKKLSDPCVRKCYGDPACVKTCKIEALNKGINELRTHMTTCKNTPNPEKCQKKIQKEIGVLTNKITKISGS